MTNTLYNRPNLYDFQYLDYRVDIPFMLWLAQEYSNNMPILEMACGTLRVTKELAKAGHEVVGVDISQQMISYGLNQLTKEEREVRQRIHVRQGDMRNVRIYRPNDDVWNPPQLAMFHLAIVPFTAFLHLVTREDQLQALANIRDHLQPGGYFLADIFNPDPSKLNRGLALEKEVVDTENNERLLRWNSSTYDPTTQTARWVFIGEIFSTRTGSSKRRFFEDATVAIIFPDGWRELLAQSGFQIVNEWGYFDRSPFDEASYRRMLFLCRKA